MVVFYKVREVCVFVGRSGVRVAGNESRVIFYLSSDFAVKVWSMILRQDSASGSFGVVSDCLMHKTCFNVIYFIANVFLVSF